jgi:catechol 2,3-dioxygenase-like lactoylglutathione lyase family enzyme
MIKVKRMDHVALRIDDVDSSAAFYSGVLGLPKVAPEMGTMTAAQMNQFRADLQARTGTPIATGGMWIQIGETQIHMLRSDGASGRINPFGAHLALEVEDFAEARRTLEEQNIPYVEAPDGPPTHQLWLLDPSGNTVELWANRDGS